MRLLSADRITMQFGGLKAVADFSLNLDQGELVGLIGPNGAGKTTVFNVLTGVYRPTEGSISLSQDGAQHPVVGLRPYQIARLGMTRTFQNIRLFKALTILDNVLIAMNANVAYGMIGAVLKSSSYEKYEAELRERAVV